MKRLVFLLSVMMFLWSFDAVADSVCLHAQAAYGIQQAPAVASVRNRVVVVWQSNTGTGWGVKFVVSDDAGSTFSGPSDITVNDDGCDRMYPDVATAPNGDTFIVWQDKRSCNGNPFEGDFDIYLAILSDGHTEITFEKLLNSDDTKGSQIKPKVDVVSGGKPVIVWQDNRLSTSDDSSTVWEVRYTYSNDLGASFAQPQTASTTVDSFNTDANIAAASNGAFYILWFNWENGAMARYFQSTDSSGDLPTILDTNHPTYMLMPTGIAIGDEFFVAWQDSRDTQASRLENLVQHDPVYWDIYGKVVSSQQPKRLNSEVAYNQMQPALCGDESNTFLCFADGSSLDKFEILCGFVTQQGIENIQPVAHTDSRLDQMRPDCAVSNGKLFVVWEQESATGDTDIYFTSRDVSEWTEEEAGQ